MAETAEEKAAREAPEKSAEADKRPYGLLAVLIGVLGVIAALLVAAIAVAFIKDKDSITAAGAFAAPAITAISTISAAYFGIKIGQDSAKDAAEKTDTAHKSAMDAKDKEATAKGQAAAYKAVFQATADKTVQQGDVDRMIRDIEA